MKSKYSVGKIILVVWVAFSILYVGYTQYRYFQTFIANQAYQTGLKDAVVKVIQQAQECKAFPVTIGEQGVQLINIACLQQPEGEE
ncbi:hypothetical protein JW752_00105 [Candidatus Peregrinibacteria bacterium]|nr:hypothetical protein [Candidatus Peregrinibacteria bacterium]